MAPTMRLAAGLVFLAMVALAQADGLIERQVDVAGYPMRVLTGGLEDRSAGQPLVIVENGALAPLEAWQGLVEQVAAFAPVLAYDRSTVGESVWDGQQGTHEHVTERLHQLLATLEASPPYVLVGWSWGGELARYHAARHPGEVAGLVYLDPSFHSPAERLAVLQAIGAEEGTLQKEMAALEQAKADLSQAARADIDPIDQIYLAGVAPEFGPAPQVPTAILLAGRFRPPSQEEIEKFGPPAYDRVAFLEERLSRRIVRFSGWVRKAQAGLFAVLPDAGHAIHRDEPQFVIDTIRRVYQAASQE